MSHITDESDSRKMGNDHVGSPSFDDGSCGGSGAGGSGGVAMKKGPWTSAEDAILMEYVKEHGEGNWNAVQKNSGLSRCGKSCRLRWANHLRPNLKKGAFTPEEEQLIVQLHAQMGNKWARMAAYLPGRTDNEIKNYWNTRIKRHQRANLPLYPSNVCLQASNENKQNESVNEFTHGRKRNYVQNFDIPEIVFDNLEANQGDMSYAPPFTDIVMNSVLSQEFESQHFGFMNLKPSCGKRLRQCEALSPSFFNDNVTSVPPTSEPFPNYPSETVHRILGLGYPYDPDPENRTLAPFDGPLLGSQSHAILSNGNFSASKSLRGAMKLELPSLQYPPMDLCSWLACPSTPPFEEVDAYIQSPPTDVSMASDCQSPRNSGLLEALLYEAQAMCGSKNQPCEKSSSSSPPNTSDVVDGSATNICETGGEECDDPISPLSHSAASVFSENSPVNGSSSVEFRPTKASSGMENMLATVEILSAPNQGERNINSMPEALPGSGWFQQGSGAAKGESALDEAMSTLFGEGFCSEHKQGPGGSTLPLAHGLGLDTRVWNIMPRVCEMSELSSVL